jgi:hypothetical protein
MKNIILRIKSILLATLSVVVFLFSNQLDAQQIPQFTQYMFNNYLSNPAVAGTYNYYQIRLNNRYQ